MAAWFKSTPWIIIKHMREVIKPNEGRGETGTAILCGRQNMLCCAGESYAICVLVCSGLSFSLHEHPVEVYFFNLQHYKIPPYLFSLDFKIKPGG